MAGASILVISSWLRRPWPFGYRGSLAASESSWQRGGGAQMAGLTGSAPGWCLDRQAESGPALALAPSPGSLGTLLCPEVSSTLLSPPLLLRSAQIPDRANLSFPPSIPHSCGPAQAGRGYASGAGVVGGGGWDQGDGLAGPHHPIRRLPALRRAGKGNPGQQFGRDGRARLAMRLSLLLLLLLLPGPQPTLGMEDDASFPHLGESSQPPPRACPPRCSCPRPDTVDCDGLDLQVFPDNITRAAQHLSLQNNQLQELPYNELSRLSGLRTLNLHNNLISSEGLPDEAFESLTQLQHIYVAHNKLSVAPQFLPRSLRVADLAANEVTEIFPLTFGEKPALSLSSNQLSYVPPSLPPSLERLHLQNNLISKVPRGALSRQTHLRELYLQHNQLTDSGLDATTFSKLHRLEYLDLSHNQLAAVPAGLPRTLAVLHLGRNRIRWVEAARLGGLRGLRYLLLQHNQLGATGLPAGALRPLRGLHTLHLYGNRLDRVPQALPRRLRALVLPHNRVAALGARDLASTPRLAELNLAYNCLASARVHLRAFRRLRALRSLDLAGNQLTQLPSGLPAGLHTLRLQRNQLRTLEPEPLAGLHQLQELSLAHNRLRVGGIGPGTWHELQALQVLDLSHNELSFVPPDLPEALEELHLQGNRIGHVGPEAFLSTPRLRALFLRANRLHMTSIAPEAFLGLLHLRVVDTTGNPEPVLVRLPPTAPHQPRAAGP
ncbi:podocan-like protein 1 isoform X2 [Bos javanicus]|uniref:podocan-like protein 1 isoform X2 n=1 Tax=Bos javanicus TaxID=9906 RepID=UPI002AA7053D|nr:podocan-like protein 1 isoform X2 [Bos javanicus]